MPAKPSLYISDVVLEVTRKCNLKCGHCLRGDARNDDLKESVMYHLWSKVSAIGTLTLTGGEPLLVPDIISKFVDSMLVSDGEVERFYLATNGYVYPNEVCGALGKLFGSASDPAQNLLHISNTVYHKRSGGAEVKADLQRKTYDVLRSVFTNVCLKTESPDYTVYAPNILARGRGKYLNSAVDNLEEHEWLLVEPTLGDHPQIQTNHLYITTAGHCFPFCDMSYEDIDTLIAKKSPLYLGNITDPRITPMKMALRWNAFVKNNGGHVKLRDFV